MRKKRTSRGLVWLGIAVAVALASLAVWRIQHATTSQEFEDARVAAVAIAPVDHAPIEHRRTFTGTLEAYSSFVAAPKVSGRIEKIMLNIGDPVDRGQVVAELDDAEYEQEIAQAEADLAVARANVAGARSMAEVAASDVERLQGLRESGATSESQFEAAQAQRLAREAELRVTEAEITSAEAALAADRIRSGYTRVVADWTGDDPDRVVAERFVDEGDTVSANTPLLRIVEIDRLTAVFHVTEKDYARLQLDQSATFVTDAFPGETFDGTVERIAPVFSETTRQARVEILVANPERRLRPGMFVRATLLLDRVEDATIVPAAALTRRGNEEGVFLVNADGRSVRWVPVHTGVREAGRIQILDPALDGQVVVLGQQLIDDGSPIVIAEPLES